MGKKSKKNKAGKKRGGGGASTARDNDAKNKQHGMRSAIDGMRVSSQKQDMSSLRGQVIKYKANTATFKKTLLERVCSGSSQEQIVLSFQKDTVRSIERAVDFLLCEEAHLLSHSNQHGTMLSELIPPLRDAIQGRIRVSERYYTTSNDFRSNRQHTFFTDLLKEQYRKLEKKASPIPQPLSQRNAASDDHDDDDISVSNEGGLGGLVEVDMTLCCPSILPCVTNLRESTSATRRSNMWRGTVIEDLLSLAVLLGDTKLVVWLLHENSSSASRYQQLLIQAMRGASFHGHVNIIDSLIQVGCPVDGPSYKGETPILYAAFGRQVDVLRYLVVQHKVDANRVCGFHNVLIGDRMETMKRPLLHNIVNEPDVLPVVQFLVAECGADPNLPCPDKNGTALHYAAAGTNTDVVKALLDAGADYNAKSESITKEVPLHTASMWGQTETVKCLLEYGADVYCRNDINDMPIHLACEDGHIEVIKVLVDHGCDVDISDGDGWSPLMVAIRYKQERLANALIEMGANVNFQTREDQTSPLMFAIIYEQLRVAKSLVEKGADVNACNTVGPSLHKALRKKQYALAKLLLQHGADATAPEQDGETPLHSLCSQSDSPLSLASLLLKHGANVNAKMKDNNVTPLYWAFEYENFTLGEALLQKGADLFARDSNGICPFDVALYKGCSGKGWSKDSATSHLYKYAGEVISKQDLPRLENLLDKFPLLFNTETEMMVVAIRAHNAGMVGLLVDKGFPIETPIGPAADTALSLTVVENDINSTRVLLERGADVNCKDKEGFRCLHEAAENGNFELVELLIQYGASVNVLTDEGEYPLSAHLKMGQPSLALVKILVENGADVNETGKPAFTALHGASRSGYADIASYLLEKGANTELRSYEQYTALMYACEKGHIQIVQLLIDHGANVNVRHPVGVSILAHTCLHGHQPVVKLLLAEGADLEPHVFAAALQTGNDSIYVALIEHLEAGADDAQESSMSGLLAHDVD